MIALRRRSNRRLRAVLLALLCGVAMPALADGAMATAGEISTLLAQAKAFEHGEGVPRDPLRAAGLYCDGARAGDAEAQYSLGWMYANGRGVPRDDELAAYFFTLAAQQGHEQAQKMLRFVGAAAGETPQCMRPPVVADAGESDADEPVVAANPAQAQVLGLVHKLAPEFGISPRLAMAVIRAESNFDPGAVSPKNAQGLMQLIPDTSVRFNVKKPFDPEQNVRGGLAYLRWLLAYFEGNVALVAAAYNAGEGAVNRFRGVPPFAETRVYVKRILEFFRKDKHPYDAGVTTPSPEIGRIRASM